MLLSVLSIISSHLIFGDAGIQTHDRSLYTSRFMSLILVLDQGTSQVFKCIKEYYKKVVFPLRITCDLKIPRYMEEIGFRKRVFPKLWQPSRI
jgi:hypothetical protein